MPLLIHYAFCMSVTAYMWDFNLCICWPVSLVIKYDKCVRICEMCPFGHVAVDVCLLLCDQCIGQIIRFLCKEHYQKLRTVIRTTFETNVKCWHNHWWRANWKARSPWPGPGHVKQGVTTGAAQGGWPARVLVSGNHAATLNIKWLSSIWFMTWS